MFPIRLSITDMNMIFYFMLLRDRWY